MMPTHREWGRSLKLSAGIQHSVVANYLGNLIASIVTNTASLICFISTWRCWLVSAVYDMPSNPASSLCSCCIELTSCRFLTSGLQQHGLEPKRHGEERFVSFETCGERRNIAVLNPLKVVSSGCLGNAGPCLRRYYRQVCTRS